MEYAEGVAAHARAGARVAPSHPAAAGETRAPRSATRTARSLADRRSPHRHSRRLALPRGVGLGVGVRRGAWRSRRGGCGGGRRGRRRERRRRSRRTRPPRRTARAGAATRAAMIVPRSSRSGASPPPPPPPRGGTRGARAWSAPPSRPRVRRSRRAVRPRPVVVELRDEPDEALANDSALTFADSGADADVRQERFQLRPLLAPGGVVVGEHTCGGTRIAFKYGDPPHRARTASGDGVTSPSESARRLSATSLVPPSSRTLG